MPLRGDYTPAVAVPPSAPALDRIGPRTLTIRLAASTRMVERTINPGDFRCSRLVGELADELVRQAELHRWTSGNVDMYTRALKLFAEHVGKSTDRPQDASLGRAEPALAPLVGDFGRSLPASYPVGSVTPANYVYALHRLIRSRSEREGATLEPGLLALLSARHTVPLGQSSELDEFPLAQKRILARAGWAHLRALEKRLAHGQALIGQAQGHPEKYGWLDPGNVLWALERGEITMSQFLEQIPPHMEHWSAEPHAMLADMLAVTGEPYGPGSPAAFTLAKAMASLLYPNSFDLQAFRVLLACATGHAPEEISTLCLSGIEFTPNGVRLQLTKLRGKEVRYREFSTAQDVIHPEGRSLNVAYIIRRLIAATEKARPLAGPADSDRLFLHAVVAKSTRDIRVASFSTARVKVGFGDWIRRHGLDIAEPHEIRRIRKSTKVEKVIARRGSVAAAADDHSVATFLGHYAHGTTLRTLSGAVVSRAQGKWLDRALQGPVLVDEQALEGLSSPESLEALDLTAEQAGQLRDGYLDMGVSGCRNPRQSPYAKKEGDLCPVAPLRCLECGNAFILPSNLPQLLLYSDFLDGLRDRLSPEHFALNWGQRHTNLSAVLAERSPAEKQAARQQIAADGTTLQIPLAAYTEFDR
ncbi:hypothetical protein ACIQOW_36650 [Kitasatospora sp. NPDC091335]|uniref:hypothetical protein n=1 Tax=Kitasatospora sp. NPDC091335 TaxID=3364085 RepID=UPI00381B9BD4